MRPRFSLSTGLSVALLVLEVRGGLPDRMGGPWPLATIFVVWLGALRPRVPTAAPRRRR